MKGSGLQRRSGGSRWRPGLRHRVARQRGVTLVDVLVGLVVALFTMVVVYQTFVVVQTIRRNVAAAADAHGSGEFALSTLAIHAQNAGAGIAYAARWLDSCPVTADIASTLRPIDVLIEDSGRVDRPDSLVIRQSFASGGIPVRFVAPASAGTFFRVEAVDGFSAGDRIVAISRTGVCAMADVTGIVPAGGGVLDITHSAVATDLPVTSLLLNLGPATRASTARFDVVAGTLRSTDLGNGDAPNPLVSNIANLKFQYGIDTDADGAIDTWVTAGAGGGWSANDVLAAPRATLERIQALRIGVIARSEQIDSTRTRSYHWVLFDCELADKRACPGRLEGTIAASAAGAYRYRALEAVVPLRNGVWNRG